MLPEKDRETRATNEFRTSVRSDRPYVPPFSIAAIANLVGKTWSTHDVERTSTLTWATADAFAVNMRAAGGDAGGPVVAIGSDDLLGVTSERDEASEGYTVASRISSCRATLARAGMIAGLF